MISRARGSPSAGSSWPRSSAGHRPGRLSMVMRKSPLVRLGPLQLRLRPSSPSPRTSAQPRPRAAPRGRGSPPLARRRGSRALTSRARPARPGSWPAPSTTSSPPTASTHSPGGAVPFWTGLREGRPRRFAGSDPEPWDEVALTSRCADLPARREATHGRNNTTFETDGPQEAHLLLREGRECKEKSPDTSTGGSARAAMRTGHVRGVRGSGPAPLAGYDLAERRRRVDRHDLEQLEPGRRRGRSPGPGAVARSSTTPSSGSTTTP